MSKVTINLDGLGRVEAKIWNKRAVVGSDVRQAVYMQTQKTLTKAKMRTPIDTGALVNSGEVVVESAEPIVIFIRFGGPAAPYAVKVHEDLEANHKVGQAKYLESSVNEDRQKFLDAMRKAVTRGSGRYVGNA